ncbi:MAG TPA: phosphatase PAP2 family protein [Pirellulales bacterium]|jgi:membrane-associated phospholipid phosphatase|nr:phosphatase PAP2 family protein [Pirellulales bacterium]
MQRPIYSDPYSDAEIPLPRLRTISHLWACAAVLSALGVAALAIDVPLARWAHQNVTPTVLQKICGLSEAVGHGVGVILLVVVIAFLDPWHRYALPRVLAAALGSGLAANGLKLVLARTRPNHFDWQGRGLDSFGEWFPLLDNQSWLQSFPSSHAATAAGAAIVLACIYPRGRWLFPAFAVLACLQRVLDEAHFLSDVFWGAAVGCIFAPLCVYGSPIARFFDRLEVKLMHVSRVFEGHAPRRSQLRAGKSLERIAP